MRLTIFFALFSLCACDASEHRQREQARQDRIFDTQRQALEKAKAVEGTLQQADQQRRAEEDAQTR
jgi:hypothetical protein